MKKSAKKTSKPAARDHKPSTETKTKVSSDALPRRTLEEALKVAQVIRDNYPGKATWDEIAKALGVSASRPENKYPLWSAVAYGIVIRNEDNTYSLGEIGRKILAPTYEGEREEGIKKALFTPSVLSRFYTDYNGSTLPTDELFPNVLETRYEVPRDRTKEAIDIIKENAKFANAIVDRADGKKALNFTDADFPVVPVGFEAGVRNADGESARNVDIENLNVSVKKEEWDKFCFIVTPIGSDDSLERKHADAVLRHLLEPVLSEFDLIPIRGDKIAKPGLITKQVIEHIAYSRLCIADLSFNNPNAFYELGARHAFKLSTIQIIRKGDKIPFDVAQGRTIIIDTSDPYTIMDRIDAAKKELREHVSSILKGNEKQDDNPVNLFLPGLKVTISR